LAAICSDAILPIRSGSIVEGDQWRAGKLSGEVKTSWGRQCPYNRSTLSYANEHRPWQLYQKVFYELLDQCKTLVKGKKKFRFKSKLFSLDATTIELCASLFDWAKFRTTKGAVKLHLLLDHEGYLPVFAHITEGKIHEVNIAQGLHIPRGSLLVIDRGYVDYGLFGRWTQDGVYFVTRQKDNADYTVIEERPLPQNRNILRDQLIELSGFYYQQKCPFLLRRIEVWDDENERIVVLLTNHLSFGSTTIAAVYKDRWQIGVSSEGRITQSVEVRPRLRDSGPCSLGAPWRENKTVEPFDNIL